MLSVFCSPTRYVQGRDATASLGSEIEKLGLGKKACLVASRSALKLLTDTWKATLTAHNISYALTEFGGECSRAEIDRIKSIATENKSELVIGAGGGKVLDTARAVASELDVPVVNCPTAASSDSPCSALSVVYTESGEFSTYLFYKKNPELVVVDTSVIAQAPVRLLIAGMGDALATMFEAQTVINAGKKNQLGGATSLSALALAEVCYKTLINDSIEAIDAVSNRAVTPALERIVEANTLLSGLGFESGGLAVAHSVHNGLTVLSETHNYYHGEKVAFGLLVQLVMEGKGLDLISPILEYCSDVGLPITLGEIGINDLNRESLRRVAERTVMEGETAHNEPFEVTSPMVFDAIITADALGRRYKESEIVEAIAKVAL
ncbi:MAG: glycerol dehydrogenase [Candidatus Obscuribacterales bacterium]|nr:glycerol dehydrogenase [Candidatus Obscuribacterales bacterium]